MIEPRTSRRALTAHEACAAALARLSGRWDEPALRAWGPLTPSSLTDVIDILESVVRSVEAPASAAPTGTARIQQLIVNEVDLPADLPLTLQVISRYFDEHDGFPDVDAGEWQPLAPHDILSVDPAAKPAPTVVVHLHNGVLSQVHPNFNRLTIILDDQAQDSHRWRVESAPYDLHKVERAYIQPQSDH